MLLIEKIVAMKDEVLVWQSGFHANLELGFKEENIAKFGLQVCLRRGTKFIRKFAVPCRQTRGSSSNIVVWCIPTCGIDNGNN